MLAICTEQIVNTYKLRTVLGPNLKGGQCNETKLSGGTMMSARSAFCKPSGVPMLMGSRNGDSILRTKM